MMKTTKLFKISYSTHKYNTKGEDLLFTISFVSQPHVYIAADSLEDALKIARENNSELVRAAVEPREDRDILQITGIERIEEVYSKVYA